MKATNTTWAVLFASSLLVLAGCGGGGRPDTPGAGNNSNSISSSTSVALSASPPEITSRDSAEVAENTTQLFPITAIDADNDVLAFNITGGVDANDFIINSISGKLSFSRAPNYESPSDSDGNNIYSVEVTASDGARTDSQLIEITVGDQYEPPSSS